jgi:hypothetical protein
LRTDKLVADPETDTSVFPDTEAATDTVDVVIVALGREVLVVVTVASVAVWAVVVVGFPLAKHSRN